MIVLRSKSVKRKDQNILQKDKKKTARAVRKSPTTTSGLCRVLSQVSVCKSIHGLRTAQGQPLRIIQNSQGIHKIKERAEARRKGGF